MSYYLSPALEQLRDQVNAAYPTRDKTSDGWIGDAAHAAGVSDHNPDYTAGGIVRALDIDADLRGTPDSWALAQALTADRRTRYVIHRGRIWSNPAVYGPTAGSWNAYNGDNPHNTHLHVSVRHGAAWDADKAPWTITEEELDMNEDQLRKIIADELDQRVPKPTDLGKRISQKDGLTRLLTLARLILAEVRSTKEHVLAIRKGA